MNDPKNKNTIHVSVVIPCYNEAGNLENGALNQVLDYLQAQTWSWEVLIVNDESTDNSRDLVLKFIEDKPDFHLVDIAHGGKPKALWGGIQKARGEFVLLMDMDQSTPIVELDALLPEIANGYEIVIGSRGSRREGYPLLRKMGSFVFLTARRIIILRNIIDTQCGFKIFKREAITKAFPKLQIFRETSESSGWKVTAFDVELLFILQKSGCRIKEVHVEWENRDLSTTKNQMQADKYVKESIEMVFEILRVRVNHLRGTYK